MDVASIKTLGDYLNIFAIAFLDGNEIKLRELENFAQTHQFVSTSLLSSDRFYTKNYHLHMPSLMLTPSEGRDCIDIIVDSKVKKVSRVSHLEDSAYSITEEISRLIA